MKKILISACLLGTPCRYDGNSKPIDGNCIDKLRKEFILVPVCPEILGGLSTPRPPCEICGKRVMTKDGVDCTAQYNAGAECALSIAKENNVEFCILKSKSPSCGRDFVYDGSFTRTLKCGSGVTAELLVNNGYAVYDENELDEILRLYNSMEE